MGMGIMRVGIMVLEVTHYLIYALVIMSGALGDCMTRHPTMAVIGPLVYKVKIMVTIWVCLHQIFKQTVIMGNIVDILCVV